MPPSEHLYQPHVWCWIGKSSFWFQSGALVTSTTQILRYVGNRHFCQLTIFTMMYHKVTDDVPQRPNGVPQRPSIFQNFCNVYHKDTKVYHNVKNGCTAMTCTTSENGLRHIRNKNNNQQSVYCVREPNLFSSSHFGIYLITWWKKCWLYLTTVPLF